MSTPRFPGPTSAIPGHPSHHDCGPCRRQRARYRKWLDVRIAGDGPLPQTTLPDGTRRRVRALQAIGWPLAMIAAEAGESTANLRGLMRTGDQSIARITLWRAARYAAVYDRLSMTPGPSELVRGHARRRGFVPPLAWDDDTIDDPAAEPQGVAQWEEAA